jgi:hypothetical protein
MLSKVFTHRPYIVGECDRLSLVFPFEQLLLYRQMTE